MLRSCRSHDGLSFRKLTLIPGMMTSRRMLGELVTELNFRQDDQQGEVDKEK